MRRASLLAPESRPGFFAKCSGLIGGARITFTLPVTPYAADNWYDEGVYLPIVSCIFEGKKILRLCKVPDTPWESVYVIELAEQGQEEQFKMLRNWRSTRHEYIPDETYYVLGGGRTWVSFIFHLFTQKNNLNVIQGPVEKKLFPIFWQKLHGKFVDVGSFFISISAPTDHVYSKKTPFSVCLNMAYGSL